MNPYAYLLVAETAGKAGPNPLVVLLPQIGLVVAILYFVLIRPQQRKAKEFSALVSGIGKGDKIVTQGGIHGVVMNVKDTSVILKIADNVKCELDKTAVGRVEKGKE